MSVSVGRNALTRRVVWKYWPWSAAAGAAGAVVCPMAEIANVTTQKTARRCFIGFLRPVATDTAQCAPGGEPLAGRSCWGPLRLVAENDASWTAGPMVASPESSSRYATLFRACATRTSPALEQECGCTLANGRRGI